METTTIKKPDILERDSEDVFLEWVNDFLTIAKMAEYYNVDEIELINKIDEGRKINHARPLKK